jgi:hypothetical protein
MAEAAKILHTDKELALKVLSKQLRLNDRKALESSYDQEIKTLEPRLTIRPEAFQAILDDVAQIDPGQEGQARGFHRPPIPRRNDQERFL